MPPVQAWDINTGEELNLDEWSDPIQKLINYVQGEAQHIYESAPALIKDTVEGWTGSPQPAEFARKHGLSTLTPPPVDVKAQSRIERLIRYNLITSVASHTHSDNPHKKEPGFPHQINLGAADRQMVSLSQEGNTLYLLWKVWDKELLLEFTIPSYVLTRREVNKWCLPTVQVSRKTGQVLFGFAYEETFTGRETTRQKAGVDLGRRAVYTATVVNENGSLAAQYYPSSRLTQTNNKRERLLIQKKQILTKLKTYQSLNTLPEKQATLKTEAQNLTGKIRRIATEIAHKAGSELAQKLEQHALNTLNLENLAWVQGKTYGSRWNHSKQQESITHSLKRVGIKTKTVNPKGTSQHCHKCGQRIVHNARTRTVHCGSCRTQLDRDFNAALNITKNQHYPAGERPSGDDRSVKQVVEESNPHSSDSQEPT